MTFSIYEEGWKNAKEGQLCSGIQDSSGHLFPCIPYERHQMEELVALLNRSDISEVHVEEVIQDFEGYWIYRHLGNW